MPIHKVLLASCGSAGLIDVVPLMRALRPMYEVRWITTASAERIVASMPSSMAPVEAAEQVYRVDAWEGPGTPIPHILLRDWGDLLLIAPATANTISKIANGIADNLLTTLFLAWDMTKKPVVLAPSMNAVMYRQPIIQRHLGFLRDSGVNLIEPVTKDGCEGHDDAPLTMPSPSIVAQRVHGLSGLS